MNCRKRTAALLVIAAAAAAPVSAQTAADNRWHVTLAPYVFGAGLEGTIAVRGQEAEVDISASELLEGLDYGFMGMIGARRNAWGVLGDVFYVALSDRIESPPTKVEQTVGIFTLQGIRRINHVADLTFGLRWTEVEAGIEIAAPPGLDVQRTRDWVDPVVGLVLRTPGAGRWHAGLIADIGGFGVGAELAWQLFPTVGFALGERASIALGWRVMDTDYETGEGGERFATDVRLHGPVLGVTYSF